MYASNGIVRMKLKTNAEPREINLEMTNLNGQDPQYVYESDTENSIYNPTYEHGNMEEGVSTSRSFNSEHPAYSNIRR
jgi:hypothetical protein